MPIHLLSVAGHFFLFFKCADLLLAFVKLTVLICSSLLYYRCLVLAIMFVDLKRLNNLFIKACFL